MQAIKIDEEFRTIIPPLTDDEFQRLEKSILAEGVREPIITWNGTIIDGHNRYRICEKHGLDFKTSEREFDSRDAAKIWIIENQFGRRNLDVYIRGALAIKLKSLYESEARRHSDANLRRGTKIPDSQNSDTRGIGRTDERLAKIAGVSRDTIRKIEKIETEAANGNAKAIEARNALISGETKSINSAYNSVTGKTNKRICALCGKPIENGMHYQDKKNWHYQCGLDHAMEIQRKYRDADSDLRENVPVFNTESLFAELEASAEMLRDSWLSSIEINESMGVKLTEQNKNMLKQATKNLFDTINEIRKGE